MRVGPRRRPDHRAVDLTPAGPLRSDERRRDRAFGVMSRAMAGGLLRTMRPHQWVKNLIVLAPFLYYELPRLAATGALHVDKLVAAVGAFFCFSALASSAHCCSHRRSAAADASKLDSAEDSCSGGLSPRDGSSFVAAAAVTKTSGLLDLRENISLLLLRRDLRSCGGLCANQSP